LGTAWDIIKVKSFNLWLGLRLGQSLSTRESIGDVCFVLSRFYGLADLMGVLQFKFTGI